ncbi:unnamed protein product [Schistocephalus solidus]|uniref:Uncharacterized protein n=1 Tax=Schistocephalus solidus TaxID=70667 RepID=A0A183S9Z3_SCHSO|nr:unnamed protein product [Schistocephalus solidus]
MRTSKLGLSRVRIASGTRCGVTSLHLAPSPLSLSRSFVKRGGGHNLRGFCQLGRHFRYLIHDCDSPRGSVRICPLPRPPQLLGLRARVRTMAYHIAAKGVLEHFCRQLKAALGSTEDLANLSESLTIALLSITLH